MQATLTSRRDHNFRVNNRKKNQVYNNELITLYERTSNKSDSDSLAPLPTMHDES